MEARSGQRGRHATCEAPVRCRAGFELLGKRASWSFRAVSYCVVSSNGAFSDSGRSGRRTPELSSTPSASGNAVCGSARAQSSIRISMRSSTCASHCTTEAFDSYYPGRGSEHWRNSYNANRAESRCRWRTLLICRLCAVRAHGREAHSVGLHGGSLDGSEERRGSQFLVENRPTLLHACLAHLHLHKGRSCLQRRDPDGRRAGGTEVRATEEKSGGIPSGSAAAHGDLAAKTTCAARQACSCCSACMMMH